MKNILRIVAKKKWWLAGLMAFFVGLATLQAQMQKGRKGDRPGREEMKAYFEENILPVLKTQREKLDGYLTLQEKQKVDELRAAWKALREERQAQREEFREGREPGNPPTFEEMEARREAHKEMQKAHRLLMTEAWVILDNHEAEMESLHAEIADERQQWFEDMHEMRAKFREERQGDRPGKRGPRFGDEMPEKGKGFGNGRPGRGMHGGPKAHAPGPLGKLEGPMFLLWDPAQPFDFGPDRPEGKPGNSMAFPNPVGNSFNIDYELATSGEVTITIHSRGGNLVKTIAEGQKTTGDHTVTVDVSDLAPGLYLYKIATPEGTITKRFLKE